MSGRPAHRIPYGMVGGGEGAFIGAVHRMAAALDGGFELVAGAFSSDAARARKTGAQLGLAPDRVYASYQEMAEREAERPERDRIRLVTVVTPNHLHHPAAMAFLERGIDVVCDKPLATTLEDAEALCRTSAERGLLCAVTYNYTGYPAVREARARVRAGELGALRKVVVEYTQGWLRTRLEAEGQKQAVWRADPELAGPSSALADIGSHAHDLVRYVTGLETRRLFADLRTLVEGRTLEDDATVLLELESGAHGLLFVSQVATGERNHLRLRVYGSERGLDWCQEDPERLRITEPDGSERVVYRAAGAASERARAGTRLPGGHPEGFIEGFANIYADVAQALLARDATPEGALGRGAVASRDASHDTFPTAQDGARGIHFIQTALESHRVGAWVDATYSPPGGTRHIDTGARGGQR